MTRSHVPIDQALNRARDLQFAGRLAEAESAYRRVLSLDPKNDFALYSLGVIAHRKGKLDLAAKLIGMAIGFNPAQPQYHSDLGLIQLRRGKLDEAASRLEEALALGPDDVRSYCNLGNLRLDQGRTDDAIASFLRAVALDPRLPAAHFGLGLALFAQGLVDDSAACFRRASELDPGDGQALGNLGLALHSKGMFEESIALFRRALALDPGDCVAYNGLGLGFHAQGRLDEAADCFRKALALRPGYAEAQNNLGIVLGDLGRPGEAAACFRRALALRPGFVDALGNLGNALRAQGHFQQAIDCFNKALALAPRSPLALNNLGIAYHMQGLPGRALEFFERALAIRPDWHVAHNNLGRALLDLGEAERALGCLRQAVQLKPDYLDGWHSLLLCMNYVPGISPAEICAEHARFGAVFEAPLRAHWQPHEQTPDPERRLRIGYVSADFCQHAVTHMFEPALASHDKAEFEIYCYSSGNRKDAVTERLRRHADHWRDLAGQSDAAAAARIRDDRIDILVDLSGHMAGNRLLAFARKPAPVQVSGIGYVTTTGLASIDYRITDAYADPPGLTDAHHTERLWRLPCIAVFKPAEGSPPVSPRPAPGSGHFTFACLNNLAKITPEVVVAWARILRAVPKSRLVLGNAGDQEILERLLRKFSEQGVGASQLVFKPRLPLPEYLGLHQEIDLALDPFPYNGGATSCHSLWMGVPFVTLAGDRYMSRMGVSLLAHLGLPELIANNPDEYVTLACRLAADPSRLAEIRAGLRARMAASPLMDCVGFTRSLEAAYRAMWRAWCGGASARSAGGPGECAMPRPPSPDS